MADSRHGKTRTVKRDTGLPNSPLFTPIDTLRAESPVSASQGGFLNSLGGPQPGGIPSGHFGDHFYGDQFGGPTKYRIGRIGCLYRYIRWRGAGERGARGLGRERLVPPPPATV